MNRKFLLLVLFVILLPFVMVGCGTTTYTSSSYFYPNWMPDGRIICLKNVIKTTQQWYGTGVEDTKSYIAAITVDGTSETNLFEGGGEEITCSPTGDLIAYITPSYYNNVYRGIIVSDYSGNKTLVPNTSSVDYIDWSPDATKLVYSSSRNLYVINRDGSGKTQIATSAEVVAWRVGDKIVYDGLISGGSYIFSINEDGTNNNQIISGSNPQKMDNNKIIYSGTSNIIKSIYTTGTGESTIYGAFDKTTLKLSFNNTKIAGGQTGDQGIWVVDLNTSSEVKLR